MLIWSADGYFKSGAHHFIMNYTIVPFLGILSYSGPQIICIFDLLKSTFLHLDLLSDLSLEPPCQYYSN